MSLLSSFNFEDRSANKGKYTEEPLQVRFVVSEEAHGNGRKATRYVSKHYAWKGYTLAAAKTIANYYATGTYNASMREGYYRKFQRLGWNAESGWYSGDTFTGNTSVTVTKIEADMYAVDIVIDEFDEFLVSDSAVPGTFDEWCYAFAMMFPGHAWSAFDPDNFPTTPYRYELFYDEPLTVKA